MKIKTKKRIILTISILSLLTMLGAVGGMELEIMGMTKGTILAISCLIIGAGGLWKVGAVKVWNNSK